MKIGHIIIQTGGLGSRLGKLTHNKPKSMVAINNRPMLFHIFERYPNAHFIIIGDYKYTVLEKYLKTFAQVDYLLIRTAGKGNAAGIRVALEHIPDNSPFLLLWSDVLLSEDLQFDSLPDGDYIGLTTRFPCSWCMEDGVLAKKNGGRHGVGGAFVFKGKQIFTALPDEGSFTLWLKENSIELTSLDMLDSQEAGTLDAIRAIDSGTNRCRPYNSLEFGGCKVIKTALTEEGRKLIDREITWYRKMQEFGFPFIPEIRSFDPLTMSYINGSNIFNTDLDKQSQRRTITQLVEALNLMHSYGKCPADKESLYEEYYEKTLKRIDSVKLAIPFAGEKYITINSKRCRNVLFFRDEFRELIEKRLSCTEFCPIHGDGTLTNTMIDEKGDIYFIDARGYFGRNEVFGDIYYDWAKLYYSIHGNFDSFNTKNFDLDIEEKEINYKIQSAGWEDLTGYYLSLIDGCDLPKIKLIHAIIWLSLASHCWEDFDSLCTAFYVGTNLLEDCL